MRPWSLLLPVCLLASCSTPLAPIEERQITNRVGAAQSPVLSRDGTEIAFAAVAQGYTNPQIWVGRADGSAPPRPLTNDTSKNYDPEFSPDGRSLYFTSSREPQGIYRVPSFGGTSELVIPNGYSAKISPDGNTIVYGGLGGLVRRPLTGGDATPVLPNVDHSYAPLWSPDGKNILVTSSTQQQRDPEWWIVPAAGGEPRKTSLGADLRSQGFNYIATNAWLPDDWIVFTGRQGETQTLWKVQLGPDAKPTRKAIRATTDAEGDFDASFAAGKLVFARTRVDSNFWALPLDATGAHAKASPEPLTSTPARKGQESTAGAKLLYSAESGDRYSLFLKDERQRDDGNGEKLRDGFYSVLAGDGSQYAYGEGVKEQLNVYLKSRRWWPFWSTKLCEGCGMPRQFSPEGNKLLLWFDSPAQERIEILDLSSRKITPLVLATKQLMAPNFSPDGRWVIFVAQVETERWQAFVVPVSEDRLSAPDWVPVTPVSDRFFYAFWSAHADLFYTLSSHGQGGNLRFLDAHRIDDATKHPVGAATPVYEFDETLVPGMDPVWNNVSVDDARVILELGGINTNIWIK
jgi:Tol biopolymer transport system component